MLFLSNNFHRAAINDQLSPSNTCQFPSVSNTLSLTPDWLLSQVPADDNPVVDLLQRARFLSSLQRWQHRVCDFQSASRGGLQEIGYRDHRRIAAGALFNTLQQHLAPPRNTTPPPYRFTGPSLKPNRQPITSPDLHPFLHSWFFGKELSCKWRTRKIFSQSAAEGRDSHGPQGGHRSRHSVDFYRLRR